MVTKENLGAAPEWIHWQLSKESVESLEWVFPLTPLSHAVSKFSEFVPLEIPHNVLEQIATYADWITPDQAVSTEREVASK